MATSSQGVSVCPMWSHGGTEFCRLVEQEADDIVENGAIICHFVNFCQAFCNFVHKKKFG